jgi:hypothetical protein
MGEARAVIRRVKISEYSNLSLLNQLVLSENSEI